MDEGGGVNADRGKEVQRGRGGEEHKGGHAALSYENVFIWPMTDGRCDQPGSRSHRLTVAEA